MAKYRRDDDDDEGRTSYDSHKVFGSGSSAPSPCGACKFLRRKCVADCIFAPYFWGEQGPPTFAAIHKVFGASNVSKLLLHLPLPHRCHAVLTIAYEAQARIHDPVYGCLSHLFALQQQVLFLKVAYLQTQLMQAKAQLAQTLTQSGGNMEIQGTSCNSTAIPSYPNHQTHIMNTQISPQTSLQSAPNHHDEAALFMINFQQSQSRYQEPQFQQLITKKKTPSSHADVGELQALALTMMRN